MKFDNKKVNKLLAEMEGVLNSVKVISKDFHRKIALKKAGIKE